MPKRWQRAGLLALAIFLVNGASRFVTWKAGIVEETQQLRIGLVAVSFVALLLVGAGMWWAVRYPFGRLFADIGAAVGVGALLSLLIGPFLGGSKPFAEGLGAFVGQVLMFLGLAAIGVFVGFMIMVAFGKDWKSRGLRRYEEAHLKRPRKQVGRAR